MRVRLRVRLRQTIASGMEEDEEAGPVRRWTAATCSDPTACWSTDSTHQVVPVAPVVVDRLSARGRCFGASSPLPLIAVGVGAAMRGRSPKPCGDAARPFGTLGFIAPHLVGQFAASLCCLIRYCAYYATLKGEMGVANVDR